MRTLPCLALLALTLVAGCPSTTAPPTLPLPEPAGPDAGGAEPVEVELDHGRLEVAQGGAVVGSETFTLRQRGDQHVLETQVDMAMLGQQIRGRGRVVTDDLDRPISGESEHDVDGVKVVSKLSGGPDTLVLTATVADAPSHDERAAGPVDLYVDNTSFVQLRPVCSRTGRDVATLIAFPGTKLVIGAPRRAGSVRALPVDVGGALAIDVFCDGDQLLGLDIPLAGITVTREGAAAALAPLRRKERTKPALPGGLTELDRKVEVAADKGVEPATLACSLVVPSSHAAVTARARKGATAALPAVVFVTGSGSQDRDEDTYGPGGLKLATFRVMAFELARAGIASLRCDDRGSGASSGRLDNATLDTFVADAAATVAALRAEPAIDPARLGMIGHSEGGVIAPVVASRDPKLRALVLMAGTGRPMDVILLEQLRRSYQGTGRPADEVEPQMVRSKAILAAIAAGTPLPADLSKEEQQQWENGRAWLASHIHHDPAKVAARLGKVAVLIAQGDTDRQVAVADADALAAGFAKAKNRRAQKKIYPGLNHLFARSTTGDVSEYSDPDAVVDAGFLADVVAFLKASL